MFIEDIGEKKLKEWALNGVIKIFFLNIVQQQEDIQKKIFCIIIFITDHLC
jgi:hypothetical protein